MCFLKNEEEENESLKKITGNFTKKNSNRKKIKFVRLLKKLMKQSPKSILFSKIKDIMKSLKNNNLDLELDDNLLSIIDDEGKTELKSILNTELTQKEILKIMLLDINNMNVEKMKLNKLSNLIQLLKKLNNLEKNNTNSIQK